MRLLLIGILALFVAGCSTTGFFGKNDWSGWENNDQMLPEGFPFPVKNELREENGRFFWVLDYDLNGDLEAEIRVWYYVHSTDYKTSTEFVTMGIVRNPYKVERLTLGILPDLSKIDYQLAGRAEEIHVYKQGKLSVSFPHITP